MQTSTTAVFLFSLIAAAESHGFMSKPVARQLAWGSGYPGPGSGNQQSGNCGLGAAGTQHSTELNPATRHHLCGSSYAEDKYVFLAGYEYGPDAEVTLSDGGWTAGGQMDVEIVLTAYHKGWFEFRLCVPDDGGANYSLAITQECLNERVLTFDVDHARATYAGRMNPGISSPADYNSLDPHVRCDGVPAMPFGSCCNEGGKCSDPSENVDRFVVPAEEYGPFKVRLNIPADAGAERAVLQWQYVTGNSPWSMPEFFLNCADVAIAPAGPTTPPTSPPPTTPPPAMPTATPTTPQPAVPTAAPTSGGTDDPTPGAGECVVVTGFEPWAAHCVTCTNDPTAQGDFASAQACCGAFPAYCIWEREDTSSRSLLQRVTNALRYKLTKF